MLREAVTATGVAGDIIHTLPTGFHRIRHFGLYANTQRADALSKIRALLQCDETTAESDHYPHHPTHLCPQCGVTMMNIEVFKPGHYPRAPPELSHVH